MGWLAVTAIDDRARRVPVVGLNPALYRDDPDLAATLARINESIWNTGRAFSFQRTVPILLIVIAVVGMSLAMPALAALGIRLPPWTLTIGVWLVIFVVVRVYLARVRRRHAHRIVESLLRIGRCPGCGYDLRPSTPEPDGARVCPECAAAWRADRVGSAPVLRADRPVQPDMPGDAVPVWSFWTRLLRRTPTIVDDRDRSVPRIDLSLPGASATLGDHRARALRRSLRKATAVRRFGCALPIALLGLLILVSVGVSIARAGVVWMSLLSLTFALWMGALYATLCWRTLSGRLGGVNPAIVRILRRERICPSCAADLSALPAAPDGCTDCPSCRSAWKLDPAPPPSLAPPLTTP